MTIARWFVPQPCGCGCVEPPPSESSSSSSSESIDPCNCDEEATYYLKIELSEMVDEIVRRGQRPGSQPSCPLCYISGIYYPSDITGTYFVPLVRQCIGGVPSFRFPAPTPQTIVLREGDTNSWGLTSGCGTPLIERLPVRASVGVSNATNATVSVFTGDSGSGNFLVTNSANVISLPNDLCAEGLNVDDLGATGDLWISNRPEDECTPFQSGPAYNDVIGTITWSIIPGDLL